MSAGSPGDDNGGEPAAPQDPWSQPADFGQPGFAATPPTPPPPPPPGASAFAPPPWPGTTDASAAPQPAGNGFSLAGSDSWTGQPPAYSPPGAPSGYPSSTYYTRSTARTNRLAIAALVCGVTQFFLGLFALNFLLAIPAIICGAIGMRQTRERGEGGRGLAIAGLVLGILGIAWNVLYVVLILALTHRP